MRALLAWVLATTAFLSPGSRLGAQSAGPQPPSRGPCAGPQYRQFDFWIGEWRVEANGRFAGTNVIEPALDGCVIRERWTGAQGMRGTSLNIYDSRRNKWHQTWVDSRGTLLLLEGVWDGSKMVLRGTSLGAEGSPELHEISWEPLAPDRVRQLWRISRDSGATWRVVFDGLYRRQR
ncbi:MAG: hypothetical protein KatS3mg081_2651 [Gemmatimonadales bacterium]|nr:MAG: hypothetical protein KatS3mg081_2651 [Gemmatimonadales bacterium]